MLIFRNFLRHNLIKIYTRTHQTAPNIFNFLRELAYAPEPPSIYVKMGLGMGMEMGVGMGIGMGMGTGMGMGRMRCEWME